MKRKHICLNFFRARGPRPVKKEMGCGIVERL